jgi:glutaredoxin 3
MSALLDGDRQGERIVVYTTGYCPYCTSAKALLARKGVRYREVDVSDDGARRADLVRATGRRTVPQIFIDGKPVGGSDDLHALERSGALDRLLEAAPSGA